MLKDLCDAYETFSELRQDIKKIAVPKKHFSHKSHNFSENVIALLYSNMIHFCRTTKVKGMLISKKFIANISTFLQNTHCVHHSHIAGDIFGYAHTFCNEKVRENYYRIPVIAHNLFRFDFYD